MSDTAIFWRAALLVSCLATPALAGPHAIFHVSLPAASAPQGGRLLLFAMPAPAGKLPDAVEPDEINPQAVSIAAQEIPTMAGGAGVDIDADIQAYPAGFSSLKPGDYVLQAVLDTRHDIAYNGRHAGDLTSEVVRYTTGGAPPALILNKPVIEPALWTLPARIPDGPMKIKFQQLMDSAKANAHLVEFQSPSLTKFWGRPITMKAWVLTPPGYDPKSTKTYPTVYYTHGFGGDIANLTRPLGYVNGATASGEMPPMLWVFLDESSPTGTHEFADSVNNGPWGQALTTELIPSLEKQWRMDGKPASRFLNGHSSGGWATLWLQTRYPAFFGGTWSTSPDPSDFHDFTNIDLYAAGANAYHRADGAAIPLVRVDGKVVATFEQYSRQEAVLGASGGQISSFDWVFSPKGAQGMPQPMFDRATGAVDPAVVKYWHDHYDISYLVTAHWPALKKDLTGKVHLYVGTADTFYLDGAAHKLQAALAGLNAGAQFVFVPGRSHFDLYAKGKDNYGLLKDFTWEMYAKARPNAGLKRVTAE